jgi:hypothetical protein
MTSETRIIACDERGPGHANHHYRIYGNVSGDCLQEIKFQKGPIQESGVNGIQNEDLLGVVIDRLIGFQTGDYECRENEVALHACIDACAALQLRTAKRKSRGVEGKSQK